MKRIYLVSISVLLTGILFAGGIVTNQNQSAMYTRLLARDATLGIDAVFYNPAGLTLLPNDGFHLSISNQSLWQTRTITSDYPSLNQSEYIGKVKAPLFPGVYAAYKMGKFAFSFGFNPIGGGGGGEYEDGLPSFEYPISDLVPSIIGQYLAPLDAATGNAYGFSNVTGYEVDVSFEGTSVFFGYQANVSYQINEMISVAVGGRYVSAKETYKGSITGIKIHAPESYGGTQTAGTYFRSISDQIRPLAPGKADTLGMIALGLDGVTSDREVDVELTGSGFTPIISFNIKPSDIFNISFKYEHHTKLELETKVIDNKNGGGIYEEGEKKRNDIPSLIVVGATYKPMENLLISTGFHYYLDKNADYGKKGLDESGNEIILKNADIVDNSWEFAIGAEYSLSEKFLLSLGYLRNNNSVSEAYQSDLSHTLSGNTVGGGFQYQISPMININLGASYTIYDEATKSLTHAFPPPAGTTVIETYNKDNIAVAIGLNFNFSAGK